MTKGMTNYDRDTMSPVATPLERHRMKMESRREALERERHEAEAADRLWTIFGSLGIDGHGRRAFVAAYHGRHDTEETQDAFESQHGGSIILGPHFIIGDRHEVASEIAKMIAVDELTIRWVR